MSDDPNRRRAPGYTQEEYAEVFEPIGDPKRRREVPADGSAHEGKPPWPTDPRGRRAPLLRHPFSGDPWGPCSKCEHPVYHRIHATDDEKEFLQGATRMWAKNA